MISNEAASATLGHEQRVAQARAAGALPGTMSAVVSATE